MSDQKVDFHREYLGEPFPESDEDRFIRKLAIEYIERAEAADREICTGPIKRGRILPASAFEHSAIFSHASTLLSELKSRIPRELHGKLTSAITAEREAR